MLENFILFLKISLYFSPMKQRFSTDRQHRMYRVQM